MLYHYTARERLASILEGGLQPGSPAELTLTGAWALPFYGCAPVFLTTAAHEGYAREAPVMLEIEGEGLDLMADLPALVDQGAYYDLDAGMLWWDSKTPPPEGLPEGIAIEELLVPGHALTEAAILATGSAASLEPIPTERIRVLRAPHEPLPDELAP